MSIEQGNKSNPAASDDEPTVRTEQIHDPIFGEMVQITINPGRHVLCDLCNQNFSDRPELGGMIVGGYAVCPLCAPSFEQELSRQNATYMIRARCPANTSFADFIRAYREEKQNANR